MHPMVAVGFLIVSVLVVVSRLFGGDPKASPEASGFDPDSMDPSLEGAEGGGSGILGVDLLAEHGSFDPEAEVHQAFSLIHEAAELLAARPQAETRPAVSNWEGSDPPQMDLGVIMVSSGSKRAVLAGRVVGVGDEVMGVQVETIQRDRVITSWGLVKLTYELGDPCPIEFRSERDRRMRESSVDSFGGGGSAEQLGDLGIELGQPVTSSGRGQE